MGQKLRDKIFMTKVQFAEKEADINGEKVILKQPDLKTRNDIYRLAGKMDVKSGEMEVDITKLQLYTIIYCTYDPESKERIFEKGDYKELSHSALGNYIVKQLADKAMSLMDAELDPKKPKEK